MSTNRNVFLFASLWHSPWRIAVPHMVPELPSVLFYRFPVLLIMWAWGGGRRDPIITFFFHFGYRYKLKHRPSTFKFFKSNFSFFVPQCLDIFLSISEILWEYLCPDYTSLRKACLQYLKANLLLSYHPAYCSVTVRLWLSSNCILSVCCFAVGNTGHTTHSSEF